MNGLGELPGTFGGVKIVIDDALMSRFVEDWSDVRSPSRAKRRRKRGFPQRIKYVKAAKPDAYRIGNTLVMHSETFAALKRAVP